MPIYSRKTQIYAKKETTYGVDPFTVDPTNDDAIEVFDFTITPNIDKVDRNPYRASMSPVASLPAKRYTEMSFYTEIKGYGVDGATGDPLLPKVVKLLEACGMKYTLDGTEHVLTPTSTNFASLTFYCYLDGVLYKVTGARGNVQVQLEANNVGKFNFTFQGLFEKPIDKAFLPATTNELTPPLVKNVGMTFAGTYAPIISSFEVNLNNEIVMRDDFNAVEGVGGVDIIGRGTAGSMNPDMMLAAEYDIWAAFESNSEVTITGTVGSDTGNKVKITVPKAVYSQIGIDDRDSIRVYSTSFTCLGNDDELEIRFI